MIPVLKGLLAENRRRSAFDQIVFRPDHDHRMLDDLAPSKRTNPGHTAIGRLRGLAELRGALSARSSMPIAPDLRLQIDPNWKYFGRRDEAAAADARTRPRPVRA